MTLARTTAGINKAADGGGQAIARVMARFVRRQQETVKTNAVRARRGV